ncbi:MAG: UDP-N-acetylglucosamine 2-epimerase (non-hydrolyzing) [Bacteroidales bacterium]|nr:UDP-N-acetylglucosamine 2-epimerase (non-hydrolyzing) [Bacteroidales bacterium]
MKVLSIVGATPQFIKAAVVSHKLITKGINEVLLNAGQNLDDTLSQIFLEEMNIPEPRYKLSIPNLSPGATIGKLLEGIESVIIKEKPDMVLVYGDNNPALAGAIAAQKQQIPVAHIEAGLRSFKPMLGREMNRILVDRVSTLLFCPNETAVENLKKEGFDSFPCNIYNTGDVMQDAANYYCTLPSLKSDIIIRLNLNHSFALATISSQENTSDLKKLKEIVKALNAINRELRVVVPLHHLTIKFLRDADIETNFTIIPLVNYFDMVELLRNCTIVLTDNGSVQKEAFFFKKCCVTLKKETECTELVQNGFNMLGSSDSEFILIAYHEMINRKPNFSMNIYGKGKASEQIAEILKNWKC